MFMSSKEETNTNELLLMESSTASCSLAINEFFGAETLLQKQFNHNFESTQTHVCTYKQIHTHTHNRMFTSKNHGADDYAFQIPFIY